MEPVDRGEDRQRPGRSGSESSGLRPETPHQGPDPVPPDFTEVLLEEPGYGHGV